LLLFVGGVLVVVVGCVLGGRCDAVDEDERTRVGSENREQGARESRPPSVEPTIRFMVRLPVGQASPPGGVGLLCRVGQL
jgi:hypothetical protein